MTPKIFMLAFTTENDQNTSVLFQNFGINKSSHPNLANYFEYVDNDDTGRYQAAYQAFGISTLPTIIFTQVVQESPLKLQPIFTIEGATTNAVLEETFNSIVSGAIQLPEEGNGGVSVSDDKAIIGVEGNGGVGAGSKFNFKLPLAIITTLVVAKSIQNSRKKKRFKVANKGIEETEIIEETENEAPKPKRRSRKNKLIGYGVVGVAGAGLTAYALRDKNPKFPPTPVPDGEVDEAKVIAMASELFEEFSNWQLEFFIRDRCDLLGRYLAFSPANFVSVANYFQDKFNITIRQILLNLTFRPCTIFNTANEDLVKEKFALYNVP